MGMTPSTQTTLPVDAVASLRRAAAAWHRADQTQHAKWIQMRHLIRAARAQGESIARISELSGVSRGAVYRALRGGDE